MNTDHSAIIDDLRMRAVAPRELAAKYSRVGMPEQVSALDRQAAALEAAADLLEIHDATGINLHAAPRLRRFVEDWVAWAIPNTTTFQVQNNHC